MKLLHLYELLYNIYYLYDFSTRFTEEYKSVSKTTEKQSSTKSNFNLSIFLIFQELNTPIEPLKTITQYYFDNKGKLFRPAVILLMAKICNNHVYDNQERYYGVLCNIAYS